MEFFDVINTRKTIRKYKEEIPPLSDIKKIADAGRLAPSATNNQNWRFIAVFNKEIKKQMTEAVHERFDEVQSLIKNETDLQKMSGYRYYSMFFKDAPVVMVIVEKARKSTIMSLLEKNGVTGKELKKYNNRSSILSMGAAIENMSLAAHALGYGSCWMCAPIIAKEEFKKIFNLDETDKVVSLLAIGYPQEKTPPPPPKKPLDDIFEAVF